MKRSFVITIVLVLISAASFCFAFGIDMSKNKVEHTSEDYVGDVSAAAGLNISNSLVSVSHAYWDNSIKFGNDGYQAESRFKFEPVRRVVIYPDPETGFYAYNIINRAALEKNLPPGIMEEVKQNGGRVHKTCPYTMFYDYYYFEYGLNLPEISSNSASVAYLGDEWLSEGEREFWNKFYDFFKIPVLEGETIEADYVLTNDNRISSWYNNGEGPSYCPEYFSALTDDAMYFTMTLTAQGGQRVDTSCIPGGYGIYMMPYNPADRKHRGFTKGLLDIDNLRMVFPLDVNTDIKAMGTSTDKSHLYIVTKEDGSIVFRNIRLSDMKCVQEINAYSGAESIARMQEDGYILLRINNDDDLVVIAETSANNYEIIINFDGSGKNSEMHKDFWTGNYASAFSYACDKKRLAVAADNNEQYADASLVYGTGIWLAVYEGNELTYYGKYDSSLCGLNKKQVYSSTNWDFNLTPHEKPEIEFESDGN